MTPLEIGLLQHLGVGYLWSIEALSIGIFFYGASSSLVVYDPYTSSIKGVFVVLFSASIVIFMFVFSFLRVACFLARPDLLRFHRRKRFSNRTAASMFVVTVINFLLFSLSVGIQIAMFTVLTRKALILDIEYPLSEKQELLELPNLTTVQLWSVNLPVSSALSLLDSVSIHARWRYYSPISLSFGGLGSSSEIDDG